MGVGSCGWWLVLAFLSLVARGVLCTIFSFFLFSVLQDPLHDDVLDRCALRVSFLSFLQYEKKQQCI